MDRPILSISKSRIALASEDKHIRSYRRYIEGDASLNTPVVKKSYIGFYVVVLASFLTGMFISLFDLI